MHTTKTALINIACYVLVIGGASAQNVRVFTGTITKHFHLSTTNLLTVEDRVSLEREIAPYLERMDLLTAFFMMRNVGSVKGADQLIATDSILMTKDSFSLSYMFMVARMKQLGTLYKPSIQIADANARRIVISCSPEQHRILTENEDQVFTLECRYVGDLYVDGYTVYELLRIR